MSDNQKNISQERGMGVGYVSLIMIFAVICLTVLASLSYQAARANDKLNEKSIAFTDSYYAADNRAKELLSKLDESAMTAYESGFFDESFADGYENVNVRKTADGYEVSFVEPVNERLSLSVKISFSDIPENGRYKIIEWKTVSVSDMSEDTLGVWDGENLS